MLQGVGAYFMEKWKYKAKIMHYAGIKPVDKLYYLYQKHISKSLTHSSENFLALWQWKVLNHLVKIIKYGKVPVDSAVFYEYGAGWDLLAPFGFSIITRDSGKFQYICVDLNKFMHKELVYGTVHYYNILADAMNKKLQDNNMPFRIRSTHIDTDINIIKYLLLHNIVYKAPYDARQTDIESGSVDYIITNTVLHQIPIEDVKSILKECYRILKCGGIYSLNVSYMDMYTNFDKKITVYNYLKFSNEEWKQYSPPLHYQNRMRHCDYVKIFQDCGFEIIEEIPAPILESDIEIIKNMKIANCFRNYSLEDLAIKRADFVLRK